MSHNMFSFSVHGRDMSVVQNITLSPMLYFSVINLLKIEIAVQ